MYPTKDLNTSSSFPLRRLRFELLTTSLIGLLINTIAILYLAFRSFRINVNVCGVAFVPLLLSAHLSAFLILKLSSRLPTASIVLLDLFLAMFFLSLSIANGIVTNKVGNWHFGSTSNVMLVAYNSVPWILCAAGHGFAALYVVVGKCIEVCGGGWRGGWRRGGGERCRDCHRKLARKEIDREGEEGERLLSVDEEEMA